MDGNAQVKAFIDRILRLKEEQDALATDIREVYAEAKSCGFDKTALGEVVSYLRKIEKKGKDAVSERTAMFDLYLVAYEGPSHTHTREATQSYAEAKGRGAGSSNGRTSEFDSENAGSNPAPVASELTDTQEQPETANEIPAGSAARGQAALSGECPEAPPMDEARKGPSGTAVADAAKSETMVGSASAQITPSAADSLPCAVKAPEAGSSPASGATNPINRKCQKHKRGEFCGFAYSQASCWRCNQAAQQSEVA